ncbi:hypothetical protein BBJ28_00001808 [Nothophytophthora sp. Chile5]|nr:hypothetical protein BBJ28_00001808 [Nothophytophthora sp. Chile5]
MADSMGYAAVTTPTATEAQPLDISFTKENPSESTPKRTKISKDKLVPLSELFSYADGKDKLLMVVGTLGAFAAGLSQPIQIILLGDILNSFNPTNPGTDLAKSVNDVVLNFVYIGIASLFCGFFQVACWSLTAARQAKRIRSQYVSAILSKEIGWFDVSDPMQLSSRVAEATVTIQEGMGRRLADGLHFFSMAFCGIIIGLAKGWELALIILAFTPFIAVTAYVAVKAMQSATQSGIESYGKAGAIAQESLSNVRTVHALNAIAHFVDKYDRALRLSTQSGIKKGFTVGWGTGIMYFAVFCTYACGMFYGAVKVANDHLDGRTCVGSACYDGGRVIVVFFSIINGAMVLGRAGPSVEAISSARAAAFEVFETIRSPSNIDPLSEKGKVLEKVSGRIEINNVTFAYPSRPELPVCSNYSLTIAAGETVALVGPSGSGKSTIVSLLERFYDPLSGSVALDGEDLRALNVKWLREQVGLVSQEPSLFATTIMENIRHGVPSASDGQVIEAAKVANAFGFISEFPQGFATEVGERGTQLSGGQKQRIAIARAIIKNPSILLLDEATSALDTESERLVQESLNRLLTDRNRTTVIVAHHLSTIRGADRIAVHSEGTIVETGTHDTLMSIPDGHYRRLVEAQTRSAEVEKQDASEFKSEEDLDAPRHDDKAKVSAIMRRMTSSLSVAAMEDAPLRSSEISAEGLPPISTSRIWKLSVPEWKFMILGGLGAMMNSAVFPVWGLIFTKITVLFFEYDKTKHEMLQDARYWALGFVGLGVLFGISSMLQYYGFAVTSQRLVARVRLSTFRAMLHQEIGWFDMTENASGALVSRLATDSAILQVMTSETLNHGLVNLTTLVIALGISFAHSWQMTLVILAVCPILILAFYIQGQQMSGAAANKINNEADAAAGSLFNESIGSIRTVASFGMEQALVAKYVGFLEISNLTDARVGAMGGLTFGFSLGMTFLFFAFLFYITGRWVAKGTVQFEDAFVVLMVIMLSMFAVGMTAQDATDSAKAKLSAQRIFRIIDRLPRPQVARSCLMNYTLMIVRGQTVALVGASGSGKSTAIALLERFYDPTAGKVLLDGHDLRKLNVPWLRERISLVSQEPVLFSGTIAENIALGKPGAARDEVIEAAKKANAFAFITSFPDGFDTDVGDRGAQVSGGQKQRIAIARAILRDSEILLLDEATSALDTESERLVQESLDQLLRLRQRTTIIVAHRLSTIRHADLIAVTRDGAIVEQGTHDQLMQLPSGIYNKLVARQMQLQ